jgi:hypothetical protein
MSAGLFAQYVAIGLIVLASGWLALRKLAPKLTSRWLATIALRLEQPRRSRFAHALGRWLQPRQTAGDCSDGCGACSACGPKPPESARAQVSTEVLPLHFRPRKK